MPIRIVEIGGKTAMTEKFNVIKENWVSVFLEEVTLFDACFSLYYDGANSTLHLLDLDKDEARTLTNTASPLFFQEIDEILAKFNANAHGYIYNTFLYHTDGMASEFDIVSGNFKPVEPWHLWEPFKQIINKRYKELNFGF